MSTSARRAELAQLLAGLGVVVHDTVPEQVAPPCVVLQGSDPFVFLAPDDATFAGELVVSFDVLLLVPLNDENDNEQATTQLDQLLDQLLALVRSSDWWLDGIGGAQAMLTTDWIEHGQRVTVQTRFIP